MCHLVHVLSTMHTTIARMWDLVSLLVSKKAIGFKLVYMVKTNLDGSVTRLKARLITKGFA